MGSPYMNRAYFRRRRLVYECVPPVHEASGSIYTFVNSAKPTLREKLASAALLMLILQVLPNAQEI
jgi:hypothetical protein